MPDRYIHKKLSELILGDPCEKTHTAIDAPVKEMGRGHRELYHDPISAGLVGLFEDGCKGAISAAVHIITDKYANNYVSKEVLRFSLKMIEYAKNELEKVENRASEKIKC